MQSLSRKTHNMVVECSYCKKPFELCHMQETIFRKGRHVYCSAECRKRFYVKNKDFVGESTEKLIEKPIEKVQIIKQEEEEDKPLKVRCLECGRVFSYPEASPEIKELIWYCSSKCREKYHSLHFQRDMRQLEF